MQITRVNVREINTQAHTSWQILYIIEIKSWIHNSEFPELRKNYEDFRGKVTAQASLFMGSLPQVSPFTSMVLSLLERTSCELCPTTADDKE